jgi:hypothetical protein
LRFSACKSSGLAAALLLSAAADFPPAACAASAKAEEALMEGVDDIFNMQFDRAEAAARRAIEAEPEHPAGRFLLAGTAWTRFVYETDQSDPRLAQRPGRHRGGGALAGQAPGRSDGLDRAGRGLWDFKPLAGRPPGMD